VLNILIVKLSAIGDVIHCLPVAAELKASLPEAKICWLVEAGSAELLLNNPCVDEVIVFQSKNWVKQGGNPANWFSIGYEAQSFFSSLRKRKFDAVLEMQGLLKSSLVAYASAAPIRIGFAETREFADRLLTHKVNVGDYFGHYVPVVELNLQIAYALIRLLGREPSTRLPEFRLPPPGGAQAQKVERLLAPLLVSSQSAEDAIRKDIQNDVSSGAGSVRQKTGVNMHIRNMLVETAGTSNLPTGGGLAGAPAAELLPPAPSIPRMMASGGTNISSDSKIVCGIIPGTTWITKIWPEERWIELCRMLSEKWKFKLVLIGSKAEKKINSRLAEALETSEQTDFVDLTGETSLLDLVSVFEHCDLVIGGDTGPLHLAAAVGKPKVLGIYGSTPSKRNGPYGQQCVSISLKKWCQPCYSKTCALKSVECLTDLSTQTVFEAICNLMGGADTDE
jgi:ADP-heptose:LPS heptosyltransferase